MLICFSLALAQSTLADTEMPVAPLDPAVIYAAVTEHEFDPLGVGGAVQRPSGIVTLERRRGQFNPLIVVRGDWAAEIAASAAEAQ